MPYVPPHIRNKSAAAVTAADTDRMSVSSGSSGSKGGSIRGGGAGGYVPPHIRNKKAVDNSAMPLGDDGPKFEIYTSEITEVMEAPKKAGYVPPSMRKNEPVVVKKKAAALTEDDFPDLGASKAPTVTGKSVAWGAKKNIVKETIVIDSSQNMFAVLAEIKESDTVPNVHATNKWTKKLDVTAKPVEQEVKQDDGSCFRLTYEDAVQWWQRFASLPQYVPLDARNYYDDYSNCTYIPHSGMRDTEYYHYYDDYALHINSDELQYEEEKYYNEDECVSVA